MSTSESNQYSVRMATGWSLTVATICVGLRFVARRLKKQPIFWDDILILVALVFEWGIGIAGVILLGHGLGLHIDTIKPSKLVVYLKVLYTGAPLYALTIIFTKLSLLVLYHRLFPVRSMTYICLAVGTTVVAWGLTTTIMGIFLCNPIQKVWYPQTPGVCFDLGQFYYGVQIPNIVTDVVILALPIRPILTLPISRSEKMVLSMIFGLGLLVIVFDIVRLVVMVELSQSGSDITWNQVSTSIWTCVEPAVAISTACLSHLRPIFKWIKGCCKLERYPQLIGAIPEKDRELSAGSKTCIIDFAQTNDLNERGLHHDSIDFGAHITFNDISDMEAVATEHTACVSLRSSTASNHGEPNDTELGFEAPSFPGVNDFLQTTLPQDSVSLDLVPDGISSTDSVPGPAVNSTPSLYQKPLPLLPQKDKVVNMDLS